MKKYFLLIFICLCIFIACSDETSNRSNLFDGVTLGDLNIYDISDVSIIYDYRDISYDEPSFDSISSDDFKEYDVVDVLYDGFSLDDGIDVFDAETDSDADTVRDIGIEEIVKPRLLFKLADDSVKKGENLLTNADFEAVDGNGFSGWYAYKGGYVVDDGRSGKGVLLVRVSGDSEQYGIYQRVVLNQKSKKALFFSGWSKADGLTGSPSSAASIYLDIRYVTIDEDPINGCDPNKYSPCALYGQIPEPRFDTGTHDWQRRYGFANPLFPIKSVSFYLLLRGEHYGRLWFDDVELREIDYEIINFDKRKVVVIRPETGYMSDEEIRAETNDNFIMSFSEKGGVISGVYADGLEITSGGEIASGIIFHEVNSGEWIATGGLIKKRNNKLSITTDMSDYNLFISGEIEETSDMLKVHLDVENSDNTHRPFVLYFSIPVDMEGIKWGKYIRSEVVVSSMEEYSETVSFWYDKLGFNGSFSSYPFGTVYSEDTGVVLAVQPDSPRIFRVVYNRSLRVLFIAFDMVLSPDTKKFPNRAWADFVIYKNERPKTENGFRSAMDGYYQRFPSAFERRIPPEKEGIWVAFADLSKVVNEEGQSIRDFNIGIHETGNLKYTEFDEANDILTLRYIIEPATTWLRVQDNSVDIEDYDSVMNYIERLYRNGTERERKVAEVTLSSGIFNSLQRFVYEPYQSGPPWCAGKCVLFNLSPDPDISVSPYTINKATFHINSTSLSVYNTYPQLDGEYIDSFLNWGTILNMRKEHFGATDIPLTFKTENPSQVGIPIVFSAIEMTRWLKNQLPADKYLIANGGLMGKVWFGFDLFDFMGQEIKWIKDTSSGYQLIPETDEFLSYRRSLSYQRPYGFLMNEDFNKMSFEMVEKYMRVCLFYGIYPSMFSSNASEGNYFTLPQFYQRDRVLFKRYIPLIKEINKVGWEPITYAYTSDGNVYIERFGGVNRDLFFTIRNISNNPKTAVVRINRKELGLSGEIVVKHILSQEPEKRIGVNEDEFEITIGAEDVELVKIEKR